MTSFVMACEGQETRKHTAAFSAAQKLTQVNYHQNQVIHILYTVVLLVLFNFFLVFKNKTIFIQISGR